MSAKAAQRLPLGNSLTLPGMPWATPQLPMDHWPPLGRTWALIGPSLDLPSAISRMPCWTPLCLRKAAPGPPLCCLWALGNPYGAPCLHLGSLGFP
jgi:hypothetical protein